MALSLNDLKKRYTDILNSGVNSISSAVNSIPNTVNTGIRNVMLNPQLNRQFQNSNVGKALANPTVGKVANVYENLAIGAGNKALEAGVSGINALSRFGNNASNLVPFSPKTTFTPINPQNVTKNYTLPPVTGYNKTAQDIGGGIQDFAMQTAALGPIAKAFEAVPLVSKATSGLGSLAEKTIAGNTLRSAPVRYLAGKALQGIKSGLPNTLAYELINQKRSAGDLGGNIGFDAAVGLLPFGAIGATAAVGGKNALENAIKNKSIQEEAKVALESPTVKSEVKAWIKSALGDLESLAQRRKSLNIDLPNATAEKQVVIRSELANIDNAIRETVSSIKNKIPAEGFTKVGDVMEQTKNSIGAPPQYELAGLPSKKIVKEEAMKIAKEKGLTPEKIMIKRKVPFVPEDPIAGYLPLPKGETPIDGSLLGKIDPRIINAGIEAPRGVIGPDGNFVVSNLQNPLNKGQAKRQALKILNAEKPPVAGLLPDVQAPTANSLQEKKSNIEKTVFGSETPQGEDLQIGTKSGAGLISDGLRKVEATISDAVAKGLVSKNSIAGNTSRLLQGFAGGLGKDRELITKELQFTGGKNYGLELAKNVQEYTASLIGKSKGSLDRIHAVLDPEISKLKVAYEDLNPNEKAATDFLRAVSDYINDLNYSLKLISKEQWYKYKDGKYIARAYDPYEFVPPEMADFLKQSKAKLDLKQFTRREDVTEWMKDNAVTDPVYLMSKRLQQAQFNNEVSKMFSYLKTRPDLASDVARPGFVQLSDHRAYGDLAGKFIRKDVLDDIQGLHFVNKIADDVYDLLKAYDRNPIRQARKQLITVFNPAVRVGNNVGNLLMQHMAGLSPSVKDKSRAFANNEIKTKGPIYRRMLADGLLGADSVNADISRFAKMLQEGYKDPSVVEKALDTIKERYSNADDVIKIASMKKWLDAGYSYEEAARRTYNSFQNYKNIGWLYEIGSKLPILGNPFVKFQANLMRIGKNAVIDHPVVALSTIAGWKLFTDIMSTVSGETPEDRAIRENRVGAPKIPFTNTSLEVQTPVGAVNAARLTGVASYTPVGGSTVGSDLSRVAPIQMPDIKGSMNGNDPRIALRNLGSAPDIGPLLGVATDTDFRGKSISDPNQNKYTGSLLTPSEKNANRVNYLARNYIPYLSDIQDTASNLTGGKDYYGRERTPAQALLKLGGVKVEQYGPEQAQAQRQRDLESTIGRNEFFQKQISAIEKQALTGQIDQNTAQNRINYLNSKLTQPSGERQTINDNGTQIKYIDDNGDMKVLDYAKFTKNAPASGIERYKYAEDKVNFAKKVYESQLGEDQKDEVFRKIGLNKQDVVYEVGASASNDAKNAYIRDGLQRIPNATRRDLLQALVNGRKTSITGKMFVTNAMIDDYYNANLITKAERNALKNLQINQTKASNIKRVSTGGKKVKVMAPPKLKKVTVKQPPKVKTYRLK